MVDRLDRLVFRITVRGFLDTYSARGSILALDGYTDWKFLDVRYRSDPSLFYRNWPGRSVVIAI